jgi:hypothetical protein
VLRRNMARPRRSRCTVGAAGVGHPYHACERRWRQELFQATDECSLGRGAAEDRQRYGRTRLKRFTGRSARLRQHFKGHALAHYERFSGGPHPGSLDEDSSPLNIEEDAGASDEMNNPIDCDELAIEVTGQ